MYKGITGIASLPYVLRGDRESDNPTIWHIRPQKVSVANRNLTAYMKAREHSTDDAIAATMTKSDLNRFLAAIESVENYCFGDETQAIANISEAEGLRRVFNDLDAASAAELMNASVDIYALREGAKNVSGSSSGAASPESTPAGSSSTASDA